MRVYVARSVWRATFGLSFRSFLASLCNPRGALVGRHGFEFFLNVRR